MSAMDGLSRLERAVVRHDERALALVGERGGIAETAEIQALFLSGHDLDVQEVNAIASLAADAHLAGSTRREMDPHHTVMGAWVQGLMVGIFYAMEGDE